MSSSVYALNRYDIVVVGGGFSGTMVAINSAHKASIPLRIAIIERKDELGRGVAFAATPRDALLNVPANRMGAFPDQPDDFVNWLRGLSQRTATEVDPEAYYPRQLYGAYLGSLLSDAIGAGHDITCLSANVVDYHRHGHDVALLAQDGSCVAIGRQIVFALGGPPPADITEGMQHLRNHPRYAGDPWVFLKRHDFAASGDVLIVGSGLTSLDVIAAFAKTGYSNRIVVVSRGGRFPQPHALVSGALLNPIPADYKPTTIREIVTLVRAELRRARENGHDWRAVIDGLRPEIQGLWIGLSRPERRRFLRHVRAIYDPHRHRAPASLLETKHALISSGQLRVVAGRIAEVRGLGQGFNVSVIRKNDQQQQEIAAAQIINCVGPSNTYSASNDPLVQRLFLSGDVAQDECGLGLQALSNGRLIDSRGLPQKCLYSIGWPMRGILFETTAVRELRAQAHILADTLIATLSASLWSDLTTV